jgi:L-fuculose-phosphate aldolase
MKPAALRSRIIRTARDFGAHGLGVGTAGNVSARVPSGFLITPSGVPYGDMRPRDIVLLGETGKVRGGTLKPSSEWRFHRDIYASRQEVGAVVHAHSPFATALACTRRGIPAFHYMVAVAGGDSIRCAKYATYGTAALSRNALKALRGRRACLLANHGLIATGADLRAAFELALEVEELAKQYWIVTQRGRPVLLSAAEMKTVLRKFRDYGLRRAR